MKGQLRLPWGDESRLSFANLPTIYPNLPAVHCCRKAFARKSGLRESAIESRRPGGGPAVLGKQAGPSHTSRGRPSGSRLKEIRMTIKRFTVRALTGVVFSLLALIPNNLLSLAPAAFAQDAAATSDCTPVGGVLFTNIGAIAGETNLGPVYGDLAGSVAATILGQNKNGT
jgi:hypothetical protein